jgi:hypothetical protein
MLSREGEPNAFGHHPTNPLLTFFYHLSPLGEGLPRLACSGLLYFLLLKPTKMLAYLVGDVK